MPRMVIMAENVDTYTHGIEAPLIERCYVHDQLNIDCWSVGMWWKATQICFYIQSTCAVRFSTV